MQHDYDVIIIGGGAAGLMCAIEAGKRGRRTAVIEHNEAVGKKIRISGGGRCNFTNLFTTPDHFLSENPDFPKSALARYTPDDFVALVQRHRIAFHEKKAGQLFCDGSAQQIIDMLLEECRTSHIDVRTSLRVTGIDKPDRYRLTTDRGVLTSDSLVIATGGLSIPKIGASDFGYGIARQFGLRTTDTRPALVPLTLNEGIENGLRDMSGVSFDARVSCGTGAFHENVLFTHRGLSGPAILQISSYWKPGTAIHIDLLPGLPDDAEITPKTLQKMLPRRVARDWCTLYAPQKPVEQWSRKALEAFRHQVRHWTVVPSGSEGFAKAEVTLGGVDTRELSSKTMETRRVKGLYFIGEVMDVTGQLGGFNFQWAWASGFAAGQYA